MGRDRLCFLALPTARTCLPRNTPCDSVAYAEGVQKRNAFLFLSFSYFSDRRKVHGAFLLLFGQAKSTLCFMYFCMTKSTKSHLRGSLLDISLTFPTCQSANNIYPPVRTYRVNRPTSGKARSTGSNARVVCSTLLCAMPMRQGFMLC